MPLQYKMLKVIANKGTTVHLWYKTQITVFACVNTFGQIIPPMVVFAGKHFNLKVKYLLHYMECLQVGWTKNCLQTGFCINFLSMLLKVCH